MKEKEHGLYKFVDAFTGEIIYIGKSNSSIRNRIERHLSGKKSDKKFKPYVDKGIRIYYAFLPNKTETDILESALINLYKPVLNVVDNKAGFSGYIQIKEPTWSEYTEDNVELNPCNAYTEAKKKSNKRYANKLNRISLILTPEEKEMIKRLAKEENFSVNAFVRSRLGFCDTPLATKTSTNNENYDDFAA